MAFDVGSQQGRKSGRKRLTPAMNVTPLVDVVLVLLIIFMVVTPLMTKQFHLNVPAKDDPAKPPPPAQDDSPPPVMVTVHKDGAIRLNKEPVADAELSGRIARVLAARRDKVVFFDANDDVPYGRAMQALDLARGGGAITIAVAPESVKVD